MHDFIHHEYALGLPEGWEDKTEVVFVGPQRGESNPTLTIKRMTLKTEQTLAQFASIQGHSLGMLLGVKNIDILEEGSTTLGGVDALMRVYNLRFGGKRLKQRQIYALRGQTAYVITETSSVEHYADDRPIFEGILKKFQFRFPAN
jgi:hypothetical protein